jgi:hypothetical protein
MVSLAGWYKLTSGAPAAPPGRSYHESTTQLGLSLAVDMVGDHAMANAIEAAFGVRNFKNVNKEDWHYQPIEIPTSRKDYRGPEPLPKFSFPSEVKVSQVVVHNAVRILDTRETSKIAAGQTVSVKPHGFTPPGAYVKANITALEGHGFVTIWGENGSRPNASVLNLVTDQDISNGYVEVAPDSDGGFRVYSSGGAHVIVDQVGFVIP